MTSHSLPLQCSICPKQPRFSDVSHLLTHIASKGHLSHYYKLKVRASQDNDAKRSINAYDQWYQEWEVEKLMSDRMLQKDKRRPRGRKNVSSAPVAKATCNDLALDPQLGMTNELSDVSRQIMDNDFSTYDPSPPRSNLPRMHWWSTKQPFSYHATPIGPPEPAVMVPSQIDGTTTMASTIEPESDEMEFVDGVEEEIGNEMTKLKGIIWPGMQIFDSATPYMKRKRNQKKEISVVERLEQHSLQVDPMEKIYTPSGDLKKERKITGRVDFSSSPLSISRSPPPRLASEVRNLRQPLASKETNARIVPNRKQAVERDHWELVKDQVPKTFNRPLTRPSKKRKRFVNVYTDEVSTVEDLTGMKMLTSEFRYNPSTDGEHRQAGQSFNDDEAHLPQPSSYLEHNVGPFQYYNVPPCGYFGVSAYELTALLTQMSGYAPARQNDGEHHHETHDHANEPSSVDPIEMLRSHADA